MTRVAVIGAGPCGLGQLRAFQQAQSKGADIPEIVCFEKQSDWGGLWNYTWRAGLDEHGEPVHGSMYRYLWSNGPKECLEFADYTFDEHFKQPIPSYPPREVLYDYIVGRAKDANVRPWIQFSTVARHVAYDKDFRQVLRDRRAIEGPYAAYRAVRLCGRRHRAISPCRTCRISPGIETFPGRVLHSHDFRSANEFTGKDLLVVGASYSAEDIALAMPQIWSEVRHHVLAHAADGLQMAGDHGRAAAAAPRSTGKTVHFKDGSSKESTPSFYAPAISTTSRSWTMI